MVCSTHLLSGGAGAAAGVVADITNMCSLSGNLPNQRHPCTNIKTSQTLNPSDDAISRKTGAGLSLLASKRLLSKMLHSLLRLGAKRRAGLVLTTEKA